MRDDGIGVCQIFSFFAGVPDFPNQTFWIKGVPLVFQQFQAGDLRENDGIGIAKRTPASSR